MGVQSVQGLWGYLSLNCHRPTHAALSNPKSLPLCLSIVQEEDAVDEPTVGVRSGALAEPGAEQERKEYRGKGGQRGESSGVSSWN